MNYEVLVEGELFHVELNRERNSWRCRIEDRDFEIDAVKFEANALLLLIGGEAYTVHRERAALAGNLWLRGEPFGAEVRDPRSLRWRRPSASITEGAQKLLAPMPGKVVRILRKPDEPVEAGQGVLIVEAMKMQNEVKSPKTGTIRQLLVAEGAAVSAGELLAIVE